MRDKWPLKELLRANVHALMDRDFGGPNITRLGREAAVEQGGAVRILDEDTDVRIGSVERVADRFRVEPWQLLAPGLGAGLYRLEGNRLVAVYAPPAPPTNITELPDASEPARLVKDRAQRERRERLKGRKR